MVMQEYWLQKKTIGGWSHVTWYSDLSQATENFNRCSAGNSGYSWRVVKAETVVEKMLDDSTPIEAPEVEAPTLEPLKHKSGWGMPLPATQDQKSGWGATPTAAWGETVKIISPSPNAGVSTRAPRLDLQGSVWLVHHGKKHKTRVAADKVAAMMAEGYVRGGPATRFE